MHSLIRPLFFTAAIAGAVAFTATPADAGNWLHGSFCTAPTATDRAALITNHFHAANNDTASARTLICPFVRTEDGTGSYYVMYYDRHPTASLSCRMEVTDGNGVLTSTPDRHSGCTANMGCNQPNQPSQFSDTSNRAHALFLITTGLPAEFANQSFLCTVPPRSSDGVSGVARYFGSNN